MQHNDWDLLAPCPKVLVLQKQIGWRWLRRLLPLRLVREERLEITPLPLRKVGEIVRLVGPVVPDLFGLIWQDSPEQLLALVECLLRDHGGLLPAALAIALDKPLAWVARLGTEEFAAIAVKVLAANRDFFLEGIAVPPPRARKGKVSSWTFADSVELLIERGHPPDAIADYTLAQFKAFYSAAVKSLRAEQVRTAVGMRAASQYDKNGFKSYLKGLCDG